MVKELMELAKSIAIALVAAFLIITFVFETVRVEGHSMDPTLHDGDRLIVEKVSYYFRKPAPKDIVVIKYPANPKEKYIKRVVAVSGDKVKIENNSLYINGVAQKEPYINEKDVLERGMKDFQEVTVPENTIFVLGDNRNNSKDSRFEDVGFVSLKLVDGRAAVRMWPFNQAGTLDCILLHHQEQERKILWR